MPRASGLLGVTILASACAREPAPPLPHGVEERTLAAPTEYHRREGFVRLEPPIHAPSSAAELDQVEIWIRVPPSAAIELAQDPAGAPTLAFPPGTIADRVEFAGQGVRRRVVDIRGTTVTEDGGQRFHVFRPTGPAPEAPLRGVAWPRESPAAHAVATDRLLAQLAEGWPARDMAETARARFLEGVRSRNACLPCHAPHRPTNRWPGDRGLVHRGTDASGFFTPQWVLRDRAPLESYGAHDRTWSDPAVDVHCVDESSPGERVEPRGRACGARGIPWGTLDWERAWAETPERARAICRSRHYLLARSSPAAAEAFADALAPCTKVQDAP